MSSSRYYNPIVRATNAKMLCILLVIIGERERAYLVVQLARFFGIYPALMYAVMFYVILNKRKRLRNIFAERDSRGRHYAALERVDVDTP